MTDSRPLAVLLATWPLCVLAAVVHQLIPAVAGLVDPNARLIVGWLGVAVEAGLAVGAGWLTVRRERLSLLSAAVAGALVPVTASLIVPIVLWFGMIVAGRAWLGGTDSTILGAAKATGLQLVPAVACGLLGGVLALRRPLPRT